MTVDLRIVDDTGTYQPVRGVWVAAADGTFKPARNGYAVQADGHYGHFWPTNIEIDTFSAKKGMLGSGDQPWRNVTLSWSVFNAVSIDIVLAGTTKPIFSTAVSPAASGDFTVSALVPGQTYRYQLRAHGLGEALISSDIVSVTLDKLPAPANFKRTGGTPFGSYYTWSPVAGADGYEIVDAVAPGNPVKDSVVAPTGLETGLLANTVYSRAVRAKAGTVKSALSAKISYTTPKVTGSPAGMYAFHANAFDVWAPGWGGWRGDGNGIIHGNGDNWGGNNGDNATFFFYDVAAVRALSGRVTGFGVVLRRDSAAGYSAPQLSRWWLHTYTSRPGGAPAYTQNATVDSGWLAWGEEQLCFLPIGWGQALIDGAFDACGLVWGGVHPRYQRGVGIESYPAQGSLFIVLG